MIPRKIPSWIARDHVAEDHIISQALAILASRAQVRYRTFHNPDEVADYCKLRIGGLDHEVFLVLFLDATHALVSVEEMFRGTVTQAAVYPREVVKRALEVNASAVIFSHNHPSGLTAPSAADRHLTDTLKRSLALVDVNVLDHLVVSATASTSMAALGLC